MHTYMHTYVQTYIHTYLHAYIHTYIYTYMHACLHLFALFPLQRIRAANFRQLVSTLEQTKREFSEWVTRRIAEESKAFSAEKAAFHALRARTTAEAKETLAFAKLGCALVVAVHSRFADFIKHMEADCMHARKGLALQRTSH